MIQKLNFSLIMSNNVLVNKMLNLKIKDQINFNQHLKNVHMYRAPFLNFTNKLFNLKKNHIKFLNILNENIY